MQEKYNNHNKDFKAISFKENTENKGNNLMPKVYISINKEIEKDLEEKGIDIVCKSFRTLNSMRKEEEDNGGIITLLNIGNGYCIWFM